MVCLDGRFGVATRFVADDSLTILKMHRKGLAITINNPVKSSLQNNCTVLGVEFETLKTEGFFAIPYLNLVNLSLWLVDLKAAPVPA